MIFKNNLKEIIDRSIKIVLNEGISQVVYHFCPLSALYSIAKTDSFKCTSTSVKLSDQRLTSLPFERKKGGEIYKTDKYSLDSLKNKIYPYYMCVSRTPNALVGYQSMRRFGGGASWKTCMVRIELDGSLLSSNLKGMPVSYFNNDPTVNKSKINHNDNGVEINSMTGGLYPNTKKIISYVNPDISMDKRTSNVKAYGKKNPKVFIDRNGIERQQMSEYEDRIYSNNEYIRNFSKYIIRIDILTNLRTINNQNSSILYDLKECYSVFGDKMHIYSSFSAFNSVNIRNSKEINKLDKYKELDIKDLLANGYFESNITKSDCRYIGNFIGALFCYSKYYHKSINDFLEQLKQEGNDDEYISIIANNISVITKEMYNINDPYKIGLRLEIYTKELGKISSSQHNLVELCYKFKDNEFRRLQEIFNVNIKLQALKCREVKYYLETGKFV